MGTTTARRIKLGEREVGKLEPEPGRAQTIFWDTEAKGFGVLVGAGGTKTFLWRGRRGGRKVFVTIGRWGERRQDGHTWSVVLARKRAHELLGAAAAPEKSRTPTLEDGLQAHVERMRKKHRSERSIKTMEGEVRKHLAKYLDRPITEVTGPVLVALHDRIKANARGRAGSNPDNPKGAPLANRVIAHVSAIWRTLDKRQHGKLGWNPAQAVDRDVLKPKRERVDDLAGWYAKVQTLTPVRRDLQLFVLFTGMRSEAARRVRWEHIDFERGALQVPKPKGGEARAFTVPLAPSTLEMLRERQRGNAADPVLAPLGGDQGWVFPTLARDGKHVIPVAEAKERRDNGSGERVKYLPGLHPLRRTYESVAHEAGITELDLHVLTNHSFGSHNVNATYIAQAFAHLAECQRRIEAALWQRIGVEHAPSNSVDERQPMADIRS